MDTAEQILVIILSGALGIFLVLAITIAIMVLRLVKSLQEMADKAGKVVSSAEMLTETLRHSAGSFTALKFAKFVGEAFMQRRASKK